MPGNGKGGGGAGLEKERKPGYVNEQLVERATSRKLPAESAGLVKWLCRPPHRYPL
jgi:hypothetical protein